MIYGIPKALSQAGLFLNDMNFQIIKINVLDKTVFCKTRLIMAFKVFYIGIQPDGLA